MNKPKVALVYDRVNTKFGGAEHVLEAVNQIFPEAPLFTSVYDQKNTPWADTFKVEPSFLQQMPFAKKNHRWFLPLMPLAFEMLDLSPFDIIISISSAEAKGVITKPDQLHISYCLTPTRYLYSHKQKYLNEHSGLLTPIIKLGFNYLRWWDQVASTRADVIATISKLTADRVEEYYQRKVSKIIYPPIPLEGMVSDYSGQYLVISRLVEYKRIDLAIKAALKLSLPLTVIGTGPAEAKLKSLAQNSPLITFHSQLTEAQKNKLLSTAKGLLMPGLEDFGITALEATGHGVPVLLHKKSGAAELLSSSQAVFINDETESEITQAFEKLAQQRWDASQISKNMKKYDRTSFTKVFAAFVDQEWTKHKGEYARN